MIKYPALDLLRSMIESVRLILANTNVINEDNRINVCCVKNADYPYQNTGNITAGDLRGSC